MSLQIGRCGIDVALGDHSGFSLSGDDGGALAGWLTASTQSDAEVLRQQLLGHTGEVIPIIPTNARHVGYYLLSAVETTDVLGVSDTSRGQYGIRFTARARRVGAYNAPRLESQFSGAVRTNAQAVDSANTRPFHALPSAAGAYEFAGRVDTSATRTGPGGTVRLWDPNAAPAIAPYYSSYATSTLPPGNFYDMAATIKVGSTLRAVSGQQIVSIGNETAWEVSNGLVKIGPGTSSDFFTITSPVYAAPSGWGSAVYVDAAYVTAGPSWVPLPVSAIESIAVLRNDPESVTLRLVCGYSPAANQFSTVFIDITLRRGARFATITFKGAYAQKWALGASSVMASSNLNLSGLGFGLEQTTADGDGNKLVLGTTEAPTRDLTNGLLYCASATTAADFMLGHEVGGASAATHDEVYRTVVQWIAGQGERQRVVVP